MPSAVNVHVMDSKNDMLTCVISIPLSLLVIHSFVTIASVKPITHVPKLFLFIHLKQLILSH